jgi:hypothetical protein
MRLVVEVPPEIYEAIESGEMLELDDRIEAVEVRQEGGLLLLERSVAGVIPMNCFTYNGTASVGPPIRVFIGPKEDDA